MKTCSSVALILAAAALAAAVVTAQQTTVPSHGDGQGPRRPRPPIDTALDVNGDEVIDAGELANALAALATLDRNRDGQLTPDEYRPPRPERRDAGPGDEGAGESGQDPPRTGGVTPGESRPPHADAEAGGARAGRPPRQPLVSALDSSGDGEIDAGEIAQAPQALKKLDRNGDGTLSPGEYRPPRPDGQAVPRGQGDQGSAR
jgi:hypothetical protein